MKRNYLFLLASILHILSCNNVRQTDRNTTQNPEIVMDSSVTETLLPDTIQSNSTYIEPDTIQKISCDFIKGSWDVIGTSIDDQSSFEENIIIECKEGKVIMKSLSLMSKLVYQMEAVGSLYSLESKTFRGEIKSISLRRDKNSMKGYLKSSFNSGKTYTYRLEFKKIY